MPDHREQSGHEGARQGRHGIRAGSSKPFNGTAVIGSIKARFVRPAADNAGTPSAPAGGQQTKQRNKVRSRKIDRQKETWTFHSKASCWFRPVSRSARHSADGRPRLHHLRMAARARRTRPGDRGARGLSLPGQKPSPGSNAVRSDAETSFATRKRDTAGERRTLETRPGRGRRQPAMKALDAVRSNTDARRRFRAALAAQHDSLHSRTSPRLMGMTRTIPALARHGCSRFLTNNRELEQNEEFARIGENQW